MRAYILLLLSASIVGISVPQSNASNPPFEQGDVACLIITENVVTSGSDCNGSITIPEGVTSIGAGAFQYAPNLTSIIIPTGVTEIGAMAFLNLNSLESVSLPNGLITIGDSAFEGATSLISVTIPSSVTAIGSSAFQSATALTSINIPQNVETIGSFAFRSATSLHTVIFQNESALEVIESGVFYEATSLSGISIPKSVTSLGDYAFYGATALENITLPRGLTSIGMQAFYNSMSLSSVRFLGPPPLLVSQAFSQIGPQAKALINQSFYESFTVAVVDQSPSWNELTLEVFNFPSGDSSCLVKTGSTIENGVDCVGAITIPNNVSSIQNEAFFQAESLTSLTFPSTVTSIGDRAFESATALSLIRLLGAAPSVGSEAFLNISSGSIARVDQVHQSTFSLVDGLWNGLSLEVVIPPVTNSNNSGNTSLNRENELLREAERKAARSNLVSLAKDSAPLTLDLFNQASIPGVTSANFADVSLEISELSPERRSQLSEILQIARKFEVVDKVASNQKVYSGMLQEVGLIPRDSKNKAALTAALRKLPASERSSYLAIKQAIDAQMTEIQTRKQRLSEVLTSIAARRQS